MRTLMCFGDSNTHGTTPMANLEDRGRLAPHERWPGIVAQRLGAGWRVVDEGLPGRTTVHPDPVEGVHLNGFAALPMALFSHAPIDVATLMLGTNDFKMRFSLPADDIAYSLSRLVDAMLASGCGSGYGAPKVLLIAPPPILEAGCLAPFFAGGAAKSQALAGLLENVASARGIGFLDAGTVIASSPVDGIHFDAAEHTKLGAAVADAVIRLAG